MANRAYLYTAKKDYSVIKDVSEFVNEVPLVYKILLSKNVQSIESKIWNFKSPIAMSSDMQGGIDRLLGFYDFIATQEGVDKKLILEFKEKTINFFEEHPERKLEIFHMEGGEAYELYATDDYPIEKEHEYNLLFTNVVGEQIYEILENKPSNLFELTEKYNWLESVKKDIYVLEPYWTHVIYMSFNKTGE